MIMVNQIACESQIYIADAHADSLIDLCDGKRLFEDNSSAQLDLPKMEEGGIKCQVFAIYIEEQYLSRAKDRVTQLYNCFKKMVVKEGNKIDLAISYKDIVELSKQKIIAALLSIEGGEALEGNIENLYTFYNMGFRAMGLTWNRENQLGTGCMSKNLDLGLTSFGKEVVMEMEKIGMLVDLAHSSRKLFWDTLEVVQKPVIVSHANASRIYQHPRNLEDAQIRAVRANGGIIGVTFVPNFIYAFNPTLDDFVKHISHIVEVGGVEILCLGSDFDGMTKPLNGLENAAKLKNLMKVLLKHGYTIQDIRKIFGLNFLRVMETLL